MSTSKFLTWTKGDRKHASSGMVQIPVEYIEIKGLEYGRQAKGSRKADRKPLPLNFQDSRMSGNARTDSLTLHEAAVQSATSLIAAMSDMLKSPQFIAAPSSGGLYPPQGRPRSRTAPPTPATPLVEACNPDPVELPGSQPNWRKLAPSHDSHDHKAAMARSVQRPHSSPQESTFTLPLYKQYASSSPLQSRTGSRPSLDSNRRAESGNVCQTPTATRQGPFVSGKGDSTRSALKRNTPQAAHQKHKHTQSLAASSSTSFSDRSGTKFRTDGGSGYLLGEKTCGARPDSIFMDQITAMRATHESHIMALKAAHHQEIGSHRAYISLLEDRRTPLSIDRADPEGPLTIDTTQSCRGACLNGTDTSRTNSLESLESLLGEEKRASSEAVAEADILRRKLSLANKTQAGFGDVRRERDHFKELSDDSERRVVQLKGIIRKAKENEKSHKIAMASMEASLATANMQRIDVLAGLDYADKQLHLSRQQEQILLAELAKLRQLQVIPTDRRGQTETPNCEVNTSAAEQDNCNRQIDISEQGLDAPKVSKDAHIRQLEQQIAEGNATKDSLQKKLTTALSGADALNEQLASCSRQLQAAESDRNRYNTLLHSELRRQSRISTQKAHTVTPQIKEEATALLATLPTASATTKPGIDGTNILNGSLHEQELRRCIEEIIMYKLDIRGYKKDLKAANAKIESLESSTRPETPDSRTGKSSHARQPSSNDRSSGLGILWPQQQSFLPNTSTSAASMPTIPAPTFTSPPRRGTPLSVHKKLPKPPPRTPSPRVHTSSPRPTSPPGRNLQIQRAETLRSLSESIISSYAKRGTPEQNGEDLPPLPPRGRNSDPARHGTACSSGVTMAHFSKCSSETLRTPVTVSNDIHSELVP